VFAFPLFVAALIFMGLAFITPTPVSTIFFALAIAVFVAGTVVALWPKRVSDER
jgi:hypothetical protein